MTDRWFTADMLARWRLPRVETQHERSTRIARERRQRAWIEKYGDPPAWAARASPERPPEPPDWPPAGDLPW